MNTRGFTFIELVVVGGIAATLTGLTIFNVSRLQNQTTASTLLSQIEADIKAQQMGAVNGTVGSGVGSAGVYFSGSRYTLFPGTTYNPNSASNFVVNISNPWTISTTLPNSTVVFATGSGQIIGIASGQRSITVLNTDSGASSTLNINPYGAVDEQ